MAHPNISKWACSLSGCDGGDPNAEIWLCGIEWGFNANKADPIAYYSTELPEEIAKGPVTAGDTYSWKESVTYPYGVSFAKLYAAIKNRKVEDYGTHEENENIFKLNLYPIAFNSTGGALWKKYKLDEVTGFAEKELFKTWCFANRFPYFAGLVQKHNPRCIICTGISYLTDFFVCFAGQIGSSATIHVDTVGNGARKYYWSTLNNGTVIVVIPFFSGQAGLNSNSLLQEVGDKIRLLIA